MNEHPGRYAVLVSLLALSPAAGWPAAPAGEIELPEFSAGVLLDHVKFLAGEELQGRAAGSRGEELALDYVASRLEAGGVAPLPPATRRQPFTLSAAPGAPHSANVLGWIEGARADLEDEVIVLGAHLDHLGLTPVGFHPGADDNASGAAVVLEVALALRARPAELGRPVLVVFFGAEEAGLVGSTRFVREGPLAIERVAVMVNVDMIGRLLVDQADLAPWKKLLAFDDAASIGVVGARDRPPFPGIIEAVSAAAGLKVFGTRSIPLLSKVIDNLSRGRSDHAPFEAAGIPTLFFGSGESDDYHRPSDTVDKVRPDLMARRARVIFGAVAALSTAPRGTMPRTANAIPPRAPRVESLEIDRGELAVRFRDNVRSPQVLSGVASLINTASAEGFNAFDPDTPGAAAGLNFEHISSSHRDRRNSFTPRRGKYGLYRLDDGRSAMLVRRREDDPWDVSSTLRYTVAEPRSLDLEFRAAFHHAEEFGKRGTAVLFFADYMNDVAESALHFRGVEEPGGAEKWIAADAPPGHPDWDHGGTYRHRDAAALEHDPDLDFRLNSWSYEFPRFTRPFYYGRAARGMVFLIMFDRGVTAEDEMRFSLFKFKLPARPRPAWDFQYVVHRVEEGKEYGFRARVVWKRWISPEDCLAEYEAWAAGLPVRK